MIYLKDISEFIFLCNEPKKADIIFVPGGSYPEIAEEAARLWKEGYAPYVSDLRTVIIQLIGNIYFNKKIILKNIKNHLFIV